MSPAQPYQPPPEIRPWEVIGAELQRALLLPGEFGPPQDTQQVAERVALAVHTPLSRVWDAITALSDRGYISSRWFNGSHDIEALYRWHEPDLRTVQWWRVVAHGGDPWYEDLAKVHLRTAADVHLPCTTERKE